MYYLFTNYFYKDQKLILGFCFEEGVSGAVGKLLKIPLLKYSETTLKPSAEPSNCGKVLIFGESY